MLYIYIYKGRRNDSVRETFFFDTPPQRFARFQFEKLQACPSEILILFWQIIPQRSLSAKVLVSRRRSANIWRYWKYNCEVVISSNLNLRNLFYGYLSNVNKNWPDRVGLQVLLMCLWLCYLVMCDPTHTRACSEMLCKIGTASCSLSCLLRSCT